MPTRVVPLVTSQIYHVFNRGVNKQQTFFNKRDYARNTQTLQYYCYQNPASSLSQFLNKKIEERQLLYEILSRSPKLVSVLAYCLMPNHFHLLLRQEVDNGISKFIGKMQNSYTRYINKKYNRIGPLFQGQFKAIRIEDENQLQHVSRYIHLNPYTTFVIKSMEDLIEYPWSSFKEYINQNEKICDTRIILEFFKSRERYKDFVLDQADYQRELHKISHLTIEES